MWLCDAVIAPVIELDHLPVPDGIAQLLTHVSFLSGYASFSVPRQVILLQHRSASARLSTAVSALIRDSESNMVNPMTND